MNFEDIDENDMKKYKKKNVYAPIVALIFILCILGYILFGPNGILSYLPQNVGNIVTQKDIDNAKKHHREDINKTVENNNENANKEANTENK